MDNKITKQAILVIMMINTKNIIIWEEEQETFRKGIKTESKQIILEFLHERIKETKEHNTRLEQEFFKIKNK